MESQQSLGTPDVCQVTHVQSWHTDLLNVFLRGLKKASLGFALSFSLT